MESVAQGENYEISNTGNNRFEVSEVGLGAFPISGMWGRTAGSSFGWSGTNDEESISLIHRAEELGVNLIDTAESYGDGHSEVLTGNALQGRRDNWVVPSKVQPNKGIDRNEQNESAVRKRITEACEQSLRRLRMDTIDVYQMHAVPYDWAMPVVMETLARLKKEGKVRWYGISNNNMEAIIKLKALGLIHVVQIGYNLLEQTADDLLRWAKNNDIGTLVRVPLAKGQLSGKYYRENAQTIPENDVRYKRFNRPETLEGLKNLPKLSFLQTPQRSMVQAALRFILDHPAVSCVIPGAKSCGQVEENTAASDLPPISEEELARALPIADSIGTPGWIGGGREAKK